MMTWAKYKHHSLLHIFGIYTFCIISISESLKSVFDFRFVCTINAYVWKPLERSLSVGIQLVLLFL